MGTEFTSATTTCRAAFGVQLPLPLTRCASFSLDPCLNPTTRLTFTPLSTPLQTPPWRSAFPNTAAGARGPHVPSRAAAPCPGRPSLPFSFPSSLPSVPPAGGSRAPGRSAGEASARPGEGGSSVRRWPRPLPSPRRPRYLPEGRPQGAVLRRAGTMPAVPPPAAAAAVQGRAPQRPAPAAPQRHGRRLPRSAPPGAGACLGGPAPPRHGLAGPGTARLGSQQASPARPRQAVEGQGGFLSANQRAPPLTGGESKGTRPCGGSEAG